MSNSPLVNHTNISPNKTVPRNHVIDTITIHCVAGNCTVETIGNIFAPTSRGASSHYGVGTDGRIGQYCDEKDRSWCTSSASNDHRAITIEVANDGGESTGWHVSDKALDATIKLVADICKRNGIRKLLWKNDKGLIGQVDKQNMTVHCWFANKSCPGAYLLGKHGYIADEVNKLLDGTTVTPSTPSSGKPIDEIAQEVIKGLWGNGSDRTARLTAAGYNTSEVQVRVNAILSGSSTTTQPSATAFTPYLIKITASALNIRSGPGTNNSVVKTLMNDKNIYTIVEEADGQGAKKWGKLKSGAGWVSLDYTTKT